MPKITMLRGLPASGKSTWAKDQLNDLTQKVARVNKDSIREMLTNGRWSAKLEDKVIDMRDSTVRACLALGYDVIVDDTNFHPKHERALKVIAEELGAEFEIKDFTDVPLHICLERDAKREKPVGQKVILDMFNQYLKPKVSYVLSLDDCVICDLDGTLALFDGNPYERDFSKDRLNTAVINLLDSLHHFRPNLKILILSGRNDKFYTETLDWLANNGVPFDGLYMRKNGDSRKDNIFKRELYETYVKGKYNVLFTIDDRDQVVSLWRELGLTCFQVNYGNF